MPWLNNQVEVFSGFLNLKIAEELVVFKGKCRVGPHIPLLMIQFNVSRDLKQLLSKWTTSEVPQQMTVKFELVQFLIGGVLVVHGAVLHEYTARYISTLNREISYVSTLYH